MAGTKLTCFTILGGVTCVFLGILVFNATTSPSRQMKLPPYTNDDGSAAGTPRERAERLAGAIRFPTLSNLDFDQVDVDVFHGLHAYLAETFPAAHKALKRETIKLSLLYTWEGSDADLQPYLLTSHLDVVPPGDLSKWDVDPFAGVFKVMPIHEKTTDTAEFLYGRGTIDDKGGVVGILDAINSLVEQGFKPKRTLYIAFGHDEEISPNTGALAVAKTLQDRGVKCAFLIDEGTTVVDGLFPVGAPVALVGISEKGYATFKMTARHKGGHSSMPPFDESPITKLSRAVVKLEDNHHPPQLTGAMREMMENFLCPEVPFLPRLILCNLRYVDWLVANAMNTLSPAVRAFTKTTTAVTMFRGGIKENVIPQEAHALVNHRIVPGTTWKETLERDKGIVSDSEIEWDVLTTREPLLPSDVDGPGFVGIQRTITRLHPDVVVTPALMIGGTDTYAYTNVTNNMYRFFPNWMRPGDPERFHGINERIGLDEYAGVVDFYYHLIKDFDSDTSF